MAWLLRNLLALAVTAALTIDLAQAQFIKPPKDLHRRKGKAKVPVRFKEVPPGICELDPHVKSFAGYADVDQDHHIFWWFFEARHVDPKKAPLTIWINGGPGESSMVGLFEGVGPCRIDKDGKVSSNPYSWSNVSNMLFIDQPNQVGFSYTYPVDAYATDGGIVTLPDAVCPDYAPPGSCGTYGYPNISLTARTSLEAGPDVWLTIQGFMGVFRRYSRHGIHIATESYGGHYGPLISAYIHMQDALNIIFAKHVYQKSLIITNGWFYPIRQYEAYYNFTVSPGNSYNYRPFTKANEDRLYNSLYGEGNCIDRLTYCTETSDDAICSNADNFCANEVEALYDNLLGRDEYDIREPAPDLFPPAYWVEYLNTPRVQKAIGAFTNFTLDNVVAEAYDSTGDDGRERHIVQAMYNLVKHHPHLHMALIAGDADYNCNWLGIEAVVNNDIEPPGWSETGYRDLRTSDGIVHGQVRQSGRFSFTRIYDSGHEVHFYQPLAAFEHFKRVISGLDIESGLEKINNEYRTLGPAKSTHRQGNRTIRASDPAANEPGAPAWPVEAMARRSFSARRGAGGRPRPRRRSKFGGGW
ncbi:Alpha/Beta hydrolase protein [Nemania sp. NC0429]|nr:Alpha/Beta hydrolase protein [Nemania sp. NC0429]